MTRVTRPALSTLTALVMVGTLFVGAPAPAFAADPPIIYYIAQSGTAASTPGDGTSCAAPDYVEDPAGDDHASISSALTEASNGDTIYLCAGTYDIGITIDLAGETITLQGAAAATTILDGGGDTQILTSSGAITVSDLTFQDGSSDFGGAILATTATVSNSTFTGNSVLLFGGAIFATSTATVTASTFSNNTATINGGAILATTATVSNSDFTGNDAVYGGAILATTATVSNSTFTNNTATINGGAIYASSTATVSNSDFTDNDAGDYGGAIFANTTATVTASTFTDNDAVYGGGAIHAYSTATVSNSTFTGNAATNGIGGAIYVFGTATVSNSDFTDNHAGDYGGAIDAGSGTITRSRFTRNTAGKHGGAMVLEAPNSADLRQLRGNTFMRNSAPAGGAIALGPCVVPSRSEATRVERANRFSRNRATEQRRTNNVERWEGGCDG
jgi:predicted outer membrane repeat protein